MSHSELDKPTPVEAYPPIHDFSGLKKLLKSRGYHIPEAVPYKPIDVADGRYPKWNYRVHRRWYISKY